MTFQRSSLLGWALLFVLQQAAALDANGPVNASVNSESGEKAEIRFNVWEYQVSGNTVLDDSLVARTVYQFLGGGKTVDDVEAARLALERIYKDKGFPTVIVDLPEQDVSDGVVELRVVEGKIERTRISGSRYFSLEQIRKEASALDEGQVPYLPEVQNQLQSLNEASGDRRVTPVFRPGRTPGTVEVDLRVKDELPLHGSLEVNNHNSANTSRPRLVGSLSYDNLWQRYHSASITYQISPEDLDEVEVFSGTYVLPAGGGNRRLALYGIRSNSDSNVASAGAINVIGNGTILGGRWILPLRPVRKYYHSLTLGADWKDFNENTNLVGADTLDTPIDYSVFAAEYSGTLIGDKNLTSYTLGARFAPRGLGNTEKEFDEKRFGASPNFAYLTVDVNHDYRLPGDVVLRGGVKGQLSGEPLISNEQFSAGGFESVRGYYEAELLGDDGISGSLEVHGPTIGYLESSGFTDFHALAFVDGALIKIRDPLPGTESQQEIYSAGAGLRIAWTGILEAAMDIAWPLESTGEVDRGDPRLDFFIRFGF